MEILTNKNNIKPLKDAVNNAKKKIYICSAWIRSNTLKKIFEDFIGNLEELKELDIKFLIRIGKLEDVKITDIENFLNFTNEINAEVKYTTHLHAKFNIVDNIFATIGSFNITGGGYGDVNKAGNNEEIGIVIEDKEKINSISKEFENIWENALSIDKNILGFIMNDADNKRVNFVGIKEIEYGMYVEIESQDYDGNKKRWIGKITTPLAHDSLFLNEFSQDTFTNPYYKDYIEALNKRNPNTRYVMMTAILNDKGFSQLRSGTIVISKEIVEDKKAGIKLQFNRFAIPSGALIKPAKKEILQKLLGFEDKKIIPIGKLDANNFVDIYLNFERILTQHFSVFGTTGSGKSYFTKKFISKFYPWIKENNGRVVIIDTHSEYTNNNEDIKKLFKKISKEDIVTLDSEKIRNIVNKKVITEDCDYSEIFGIKKLSDIEINILEQAYKATIEGKDEDKKKIIFKEKIKSIMKKEEDVDRAEIIKDLDKFYREEFEKNMEFSIAEDIFEDICKEKVKSEGLVPTQKDGKARIHELIEEYLEKMKEKKLYKKLKKYNIDKEVNSVLKPYYDKKKEIFSQDHFMKIIELLKEDEVGFFNEKIIEKIKEPAIYIIDLKNTNDIDEKRYIVASISESIFNEAKLKNGEFKTLIVAEEAHNYAPEGEGKGKNSSKVLKKIASEGRKFNVGLMVVSQRPAFVSKGILAQCNTNAIFRLVNKHDIDAIETQVEAISSNFLRQIPAYETGKCIITGIGVKEAVEVII